MRALSRGQHARLIVIVMVMVIVIDKRLCGAPIARPTTHFSDAAHWS